jgi:hypothetical protein
MKNVTYIEGWAKHDPLFHKGDIFANNLTAKDVLCSVKNEGKKKAKRISKRKRYEINREKRCYTN